MAIVGLPQRRASVREVPGEVRTRRAVPEVTSQENINIAPPPQINESAFGRSGRALSAAGNQLASLGGRLAQRNAQEQDFKDELAYAKFQNKAVENFQNIRRNAPEDGVGLTDQFYQGYDESRSTFLNDEISPRNQAKYTEKTEVVRGKFGNKAATEEHKIRGTYQVDQIGRLAAGERAGLIATPTDERLEDAKEKTLNLIDKASGLSDAQKSQLKETAVEALSEAKLKGLIKKDPAAAAKEIQDRQKAQQKAGKKIESQFKFKLIDRRKNTPVPHRKRSPGAKVQGIIIHHTAGPNLEGGINAGRSGRQKGTGAHIYVDRDGSVHLLVDGKMRTAHIRSPGHKYRTDKGRHTRVLSNDNTIGIEVVAMDDNDVTEAQQKAVAGVVQQLHKEHGFDMKNVVGHGEIQNNKQKTEGKSVMSFIRRNSTGEGTKLAETARTQEQTKVASLDKGSGLKGGKVIDQDGRPVSDEPGSKTVLHSERHMKQLEILKAQAQKALAKQEEAQQKQQLVEDALFGGEVSAHDTAAMRPVDKAFNEIYEPGTDFVNGAGSKVLDSITAAKGAYPKRIIQSLEGGLESIDPAERLPVYQKLHDMERRNQRQFAAIQGAIKLHEELEKFREYTRFAKAEVAVKKMIEDEELRKKLKDDVLIPEARKAAEKITIDKIEDLFDESIFSSGPDRSPIPDVNNAMKVDYRRLFEQGYLKSGNGKGAAANANLEFKKVWGETRMADVRVEVNDQLSPGGKKTQVTSRARIMRYPIENYIDPINQEAVKTKLVTEVEEALNNPVFQEGLKTRGYSVVGDYEIVSDDNVTRHGHDAFHAGKTREEDIIALDGLVLKKQVKVTPAWLIRVPIGKNGDVLDWVSVGWFDLEGIAQIDFNGKQARRSNDQHVETEKIQRQKIDAERNKRGLEAFGITSSE